MGNFPAQLFISFCSFCCCCFGDFVLNMVLCRWVDILVEFYRCRWDVQPSLITVVGLGSGGLILREWVAGFIGDILTKTCDRVIPLHFEELLLEIMRPRPSRRRNPAAPTWNAEDRAPPALQRKLTETERNPRSGKICFVTTGTFKLTKSPNQPRRNIVHLCLPVDPSLTRARFFLYTLITCKFSRRMYNPPSFERTGEGRTTRREEREDARENAGEEALVSFVSHTRTPTHTHIHTLSQLTHFKRRPLSFGILN